MNKDADKTKEQLIAELAELRKQSKKREEEQKAANQQLEASHIEFRKSLIDTLGNMSDGFVSLDENWHYTYVNNKAGEMFGRKAEDLVGKHIWTEFPEGIGQPFYKNYYKAVETQKAICFEDYYSPWDRWFENRIFPYKKGLSIFFHDITERKQAEEKLRANNQQLQATEQQLRAVNQQLTASEAKFKSYIQNAPDGIFIANEKGKYIEVNKTACEITGYSEAELLKLTIPELIQEEYSGKARNHFQTLGKEGFSRGELGFVTKSGEKRFWSVDAVKLSETRFLGFAKDITERKQAEEAFTSSEERLRILFESAPDAYYIIDLKGNFIDGNRVAERILGYNREELIGKNFAKLNLLSSKDLPAALAYLAMNVLGKSTGPDEFTLHRKDGDIVPVEIHTHPVKIAGKRVVLGIARDITERKQAEEKLIESEEIYRNLFHNAQVGLYRTRIEDGKILESNEQLAIMFGYKTRNEFINEYKTSENYVDPGTREKMLEIITEKGEINNYEAQFYRKDRSMFWANYSAKVYPEKGWIEGVAEDITQRKQAEAELLKLSTAVTQSPSVIAITDTDGKLEYVNPKFIEITGYSQEEVIGQNSRVLKSGEQSDEMYKELWETISSGKVWRGEFHNKKKNGGLFWEMASVSPIFDKQGKIVNYIKAAKDITERKQAEDNFKHSIDESPLGIRIVNQAGKTIYINKALLDIYEYSSLDEFNNTKAIDRYTGESYQEHLKRRKIRQKGGDVSDYEISIRRKNGEIRHIKVWRKEVIWNREKHFQVINQNITELKRLNTDLILAKEKAEESDRLKSAFLANMSHEIRTPMNGILGFTELLKEPNLSTDDQQNFIQTIQISGERMLNTINNIVDVSKIESGLTKVDIDAVDINEKMEFAYNFFKPEIEKKGLQFTYNIGLPSEDAIIMTDNEKVYGILTNLIKNAIKFTYDGSIEFGYVLKSDSEPAELEFYVKDTGAGITENQKEFIFERFRQGTNDYSRLYEGSGLGLSISKSYIEMLGGKIWLESEEGLGSTFYFILPYQRQSAMEDNKRESAQKEKLTPVSNLSVIVAEDDEISQLLLKTILEKEVKSITFTSNGKEAIKKCRENPDTDIILMDIKMPEMNGYDATREIRKFNPDVTIIAQTSFGLASDREKALEAGCDDYIAKPIKKEILFEKIRACLDKKSI